MRSALTDPFLLCLFHILLTITLTLTLVQEFEESSDNDSDADYSVEYSDEVDSTDDDESSDDGDSSLDSEALALREARKAAKADKKKKKKSTAKEDEEVVEEDPLVTIQRQHRPKQVCHSLSFSFSLLLLSYYDYDGADEYTNLCLSSLLPALSIHIFLTFPSPISFLHYTLIVIISLSPLYPI
jgi:hypothetical protein